jgi:hypothetical protein
MAKRNWARSLGSKSESISRTLEQFRIPLRLAVNVTCPDLFYQQGSPEERLALDLPEWFIPGLAYPKLIRCIAGEHSLFFHHTGLLSLSSRLLLCLG